MVSRAVLLRRVLAAAAAVCCIAALTFTPRSLQLATEPETVAVTFTPLLWTSQLEKEHKVQPQEEDQEVHRRALRTVGVPGEGLLLAVANSDEDAVDEFGHEQSFLPIPHKDLFPTNRYANPRGALVCFQGNMPPLRPGWL